jgi:hypothetical protein
MRESQKGNLLRIWRLTGGPSCCSSLLYTLTFSSFSVNRLPHSTFNVMAGKSHQLERAIKEIQGRRPAPDIDFTQHQLENGFTVSTQERVVKEVRLSFPLTLAWQSLLMIACARGGNASAGSSPGYEHPDRRAILFQNGKGQAGHCLS